MPLRVLTLLALAAALAGCLDPVGAVGLRSARLVLVEDHVRVVAVEGNATPIADFGPHCAEVSHDAETGRVTLRADRAPDVIVLRRYLPSEDTRVATFGSRVDWAGIGDGGRVAIESPFRGGPPLAEIALVRGTVEVDGEAVPAGGHVGPARAYELDEDGSRHRVEERLTVRDLGEVKVRVAGPVRSCM